MLVEFPPTWTTRAPAGGAGPSVGGGGIGGVLDESDDPAGHEPRGAHRRPRPGDLGHLDHATRGAYLDAPARPGGTDLIGLRPVPGIDHDLDAVPLHCTLQERKNIPDIPLRAPLKLQAHSPSPGPRTTCPSAPPPPLPSRRSRRRRHPF